VFFCYGVSSRRYAQPTDGEIAARHSNAADMPRYPSHLQRGGVGGRRRARMRARVRRARARDGFLHLKEEHSLKFTILRGGDLPRHVIMFY
jgi:hypothetical protein